MNGEVMKIRSVIDEQGDLLYYERQMVHSMIRVVCAQESLKTNASISTHWDEESKIEVIVNEYKFTFNMTFKVVMDTLGFEKSITDTIDSFKYELRDVIKLTL